MKKFYIAYVYCNTDSRNNTFDSVVIVEKEDIRTEDGMRKLVDAIQRRHSYNAVDVTIINVIELSA